MKKNKSAQPCSHIGQRRNFCSACGAGLHPDAWQTAVKFALPRQAATSLLTKSAHNGSEAARQRMWEADRLHPDPERREAAYRALYGSMFKEG